VKKAILKIVKFYQKVISPLLGHRCRFYPSCSEYYCLTLEKHGVVRGTWRGFRRITRCHPWNKGGVDLP